MMRATRSGAALFQVLFYPVVTSTFFARSVSSLASTSASSMADTVPSVRACILGGGVAGCAAASSILSAPSSLGGNDVMLLEMGRGVGGRASTRFSREDKRIAINHGAPHAEIQTQRGLGVMKELERLGFAKPSTTFSNGMINDDDACQSDVKSDTVTMEHWTGNPTMHRISEGLLERLPNERRPRTLFRNMVREVEPIYSQMEDSKNAVKGWRLKDRDGNALVETEWLVVAGSGIAHPRWTAAFGGEPPLLEAAKHLENQDLDRALETIGSVHSKAVQAALMAFDLAPDSSGALFFQNTKASVLQTPDDPVLEKIVLQKNDDNSLLSVVAHSNSAFAESAKDTYGSRSTASRVGGATSSADREQEVLGTLMDAVKRVLTSQKSDSGHSFPTPSFGPLLHRWGNAFPEGPSLSLSDAIVEDAKIAFCGDYVGSEDRFGTFEGALVSGEAVGSRLQTILTE